MKGTELKTQLLLNPNLNKCQRILLNPPKWLNNTREERETHAPSQLLVVAKITMNTSCVYTYLHTSFRPKLRQMTQQHISRNETCNKFLGVLALEAISLRYIRIVA